ncbi:CBS domain-containing protein [Streptomyces achromogenes]|uniref:CBS domain-containing protein n=1 Tax=Streptomyces achromogenes TaxID=67255 RepID=UPI0036BF9FC8
MKHNTVGSVMTTDVVSASYGTPFKEVARLLADHRISGLPVVDEEERVLGVISENDLLARQAETPDPYGPKRRFRVMALTRGARRRAAKAAARTAGLLMTAPPVTVRAGDTIVEAARTMAQRGVERLPVVDDEGRLVGIVTRRDLLRVFLRPDTEIRDEVVEGVLVRLLWLPAQGVDVSVVDGVVTLAGQMERKCETEIAVSMTQQIDGVVGVVDNLTFQFDDTHAPTGEPALHGVAEDWLRRL